MQGQAQNKEFLQVPPMKENSYQSGARASQSHSGPGVRGSGY